MWDQVGVTKPRQPSAGWIWCVNSKPYLVTSSREGSRGWMRSERTNCLKKPSLLLAQELQPSIFFQHCRYGGIKISQCCRQAFISKQMVLRNQQYGWRWFGAVFSLPHTTVHWQSINHNMFISDEADAFFFLLFSTQTHPEQNLLFALNHFSENIALLLCISPLAQ